LSPSNGESVRAGNRLDSWKEIAAYLKRTERTVRRWEKLEGLPVHRLQHAKRGSVYAYSGEVDAWFESRRELVAATLPGDASLAGQPELRAASRWSGPALVATMAAVALAIAAGSWIAWKRATPRVSAEAARIVKSADFESPSNSQVRASIKRYEEAIRIDPTYAPAWAGLGTAHIALTYFGDVSGRDTLNEAKRASEEALRLDPLQSAAWRSLAWVSHYLEWDHPRAEERFLKAIALDPQEPRALEWYTNFLMDLGRFDEALTYTRRAQNASPRWLLPVATNGYLYYLTGHMDLAIAQYERALEWDPNFGLAVQQLGRVYLAQRRDALAIEQFRRSSQLMGDVPFAAADLGYALAVTGRRPEAQKMLSEFVAARERGYYPAFVLAEIDLGLGNTDAALDWLERACDEGNVGWNLPSADPLYDPVRTHPHFVRLMERMHLPTETNQRGMRSIDLNSASR
jgi:tetratricopeptide (TPR) repeat protein